MSFSDRQKHNKKPYKTIPFLLLFSIFTLMLTVLLYAVMPLIYAYILAINLVSLTAYAIDKILAAHQKQRIMEKTLLFLGLVGGSAGSLLAIQILRHKSQKASFQGKLGLILLIQLGIMYVMIMYF